LKVGVVHEKNSEQVSVGSKVTIESDGKTTEFHIVGDYEADPKQKKISLNSPIGQALAGKKIRDKVSVLTPSGRRVYKITRVK